MKNEFTLIAFDGPNIVAKHKVQKSIKAEINAFRKKTNKECGPFSGISLRDDNKDKLVDFGIFKDADGDEFVQIG